MRNKKNPLVSVVIDSKGTLLDQKERTKMRRRMSKEMKGVRKDLQKRSGHAVQAAKDNPALTAALSAGALGLFMVGLSAGRRLS